MQNTAVNRAAVYVKDTMGVAHGDTDPGTQLAESLEFCKLKGLDVAVQYHDAKASREDFKQMMADATGAEPPFDHVVVWKLRYFSWVLEEAVLERDRLAAHGIRLLSVTESSPDG